MTEWLKICLTVLVNLLYEYLERRGYSIELIEFALNNYQKINWNEWILNKVEDYSKIFNYSHIELVEQLKYERFKEEQVEYVINRLQIDWKKNAKKRAKSYLKSSDFSYNRLLKQLLFDKFTKEEAVFGVNNCGKDWSETEKDSATILGRKLMDCLMLK